MEGLSTYRVSPGIAAKRHLGVTLLEVVFYTAVVGLLLASIGMTLSSNVSMLQARSAQAETRSAGAHCVQRIHDEVLLADAGTLPALPAPPNSLDSLTFDRLMAVSLADGTTTWQTNRLELRYDPLETDDGQDEDGDGLVDECEVWLILRVDEPDEIEVKLCSDVSEYGEGETPDNTDENGNGLRDERGLSFCDEGGVITTRLTVESRTEQGLVVQRTITTALRPRN